MTKAFTMQYIDDLAIITFDLSGEKVNILKRDVMDDLERILLELERKADSVKGVVIYSAKKTNFIAGADLAEIENIHDETGGTELARQGQSVLNKLAALPFPVVAAINGSCLGGGTELALACRYRVITDEPQSFIALPEVNLGIIPGFGGTQRLPRLIGIPQALKMITTGARVYPKKALRMGLVDEVVPVEHLLNSAKRMIRQPQTGKHRKVFGSVFRNPFLFLEKIPIGRSMIFDKAKKAVRQHTGRHYPAPLAAIEAIEYGYSHGMKNGLEREALLLGRMAVTDVSKKLIGVFRLQEKFSNIDRTPAAYINNICLLGAGVMGAGIATLAAERGLSVRIINRSARRIGQALRSLAAHVGRKKKKLAVTASEAEWIQSRVTYDTEIRGVGGTDIVLEVIAEQMDAKKSIFAEIDKAVSEETLILSNTSSLSISEMAEDVLNPQRVAGLHFFNPVDKMQLVEVVKGEQTSDATVDSLMAFSRRLGKIPVEVKDRPGFLVNRLLLPYMNEAAFLLEEGVQVETVDKAMISFGMPMGAFALMDLVGIDIAAHVGENLYRGLGERLKPSLVLEAMRNIDRFGKKSGKGFYLYDKKKGRIADPDLNTILAHLISGKKSINTRGINERLFLPMINEASFCLEEGVVSTPEAVDIAMIFGAGFPPFKGGLLRYADTLGADRIVSELQKLAESYGERFIPARLLADQAASGDSFYTTQTGDN